MIHGLLRTPYQHLKSSSGFKMQRDPLPESKAKLQAQDSLEAPIKQARQSSWRPVFHHALPKLRGQHKPQAVDLKGLVEQINSPTWTFSDGERIYKALSGLIDKEPCNTAAVLWRGILGRIMGYDARKDLHFVLARDPSNRLARLNLAILPITCRDVRSEDISYKYYFEVIDDFLNEHPQDYFGQLIKVALEFKKWHLMGETISALESLYLRYPRRASTTALMAAVFKKNWNRKAACDFARETLVLEPLHPLARNIILQDIDSKDSSLQQVPYFKPPTSMGIDEIDLVFMAPHILQDPPHAAENK